MIELEQRPDYVALFGPTLAEMAERQARRELIASALEAPDGGCE